MHAKPKHLRAALAQINVVPGQPALNTATMLKGIAAAKQKKARLIVFPELAIPGYLIGDNWERNAFLRECEECGERIRAAAKNITVVFGNVAMDWGRKNEDGRVRKYNALFVAERGKFIGPRGAPYNFVIKTLSPNYREFDESRYFYDLRKLAQELGQKPEKLISPVKACGLALACILCEDAWDADYGVSPLRIMAKHPVDIILNSSSSPFTLNKNRKRETVFSGHCARLRRPLIYVNNVGIQNNGKTVYTFDGSSCVYDSGGNCRRAGRRFEENIQVFDIPMDGTPFGRQPGGAEDDIGAIYEALCSGLQSFLKQIGIKRMVVGLSGGIDSAVAACLCRQTLPRKNLLLINMPGRFNSPVTIRLARAIAKNLGCYYVEIPIDPSVKLTVSQIDNLAIKSFANALRGRLRLNGPILENIQARDRSARILAAAAAAFGGAFTCNANKAEMTIGYTTMYGDLAGCLAPLGDLWKREVYALAKFMNKNIFKREIIPAECFDLKPSAELSPKQNVDKNQGDPLCYPYHDRLFAAWVERWQRVTPEEILAWRLAGRLEKEIGCEVKAGDIFKNNRVFIADLERWWEQYCGLGIAKRIQAPPVLAVKKRAFGFDHREAQTPPWYSARYRKLKQQLLKRRFS
ncbi:MAG: NAD(+) synthase [Kiritimatiellae bacterium]|nr:NAD(+) synthase [Kiritimatiellia bacterium]